MVKFLLSFAAGSFQTALKIRHRYIRMAKYESGVSPTFCQ